VIQQERVQLKLKKKEIWLEILQRIAWMELGWLLKMLNTRLLIEMMMIGKGIKYNIVNFHSQNVSAEELIIKEESTREKLFVV
jgi:hypothetical protein